MPEPTAETIESTASAAEVAEEIEGEPAAAPIAPVPGDEDYGAAQFNRLRALEDDGVDLTEEDEAGEPGDEDDIAKPEVVGVTRESLIEAGWTFKEDGTPVAPTATTVRPAPGAPAAPVAGDAAPPTPAPPVVAPGIPKAPTEFNHGTTLNEYGARVPVAWQVSADGDSLHEAWLEDESSQEAQDWIAANSREEYRELQRDYSVAQLAYAPEVQRRYERAIPAVVPTFLEQKRIAEQDFARTNLAELGLPEASSAAIVTQFAPLAVKQLQTLQDMEAANFRAQGLSPERAQAQATVKILSNPLSAQAALAFAIMENLDAYGKALLEADRATRATAPAAPAVPATPKPIPPAPAMGGSGGRSASAAPPASASSAPPNAMEREWAAKLGKTPEEFAAWRRKNPAG